MTATSHRPVRTQPWLHQHGHEVQAFGTVRQFPVGLSAEARVYSCQRLNRILADSQILYAQYKKHHWLMRGPTFYALHLLLDKHAAEQLVIIDALARLLPGALGDERSNVEDSFVQGLLDWPHYTRPESFEGHSVPPVLLSGDHAQIRRWRLAQAFTRTVERRPDMLSQAKLAPETRRALDEFLAARAAGNEDRGE